MAGKLWTTFFSPFRYHCLSCLYSQLLKSCLQCFDADDWVAGRASGL